MFGGKYERYDIPISKIQQVGANALIHLTLKDFIDKYKVNLEDPLPTSPKDPWTSPSGRIDLSKYEKKSKIIV